MTKVSKYPLNKSIENRVFELFYKSIADLKTSNQVQEFFIEFLTPTEQIMLAKRLAIALMLNRHYTYSSIVDFLKVSPDTIGMISYWLKTRGVAFQRVINKIVKDEKEEEFWDNLEELFHIAIIPRPGTDWSKASKDRFQGLRKRRTKRNIL